MQQSTFLSEPIRNIQLFYYSSPNHIFINTVLIELFNDKFIPQNINLIKTQINQPNHHSYGTAPFLCINRTNIVKKQQLWDFITLILHIDISRKYQLLSIIQLTQEIAQITNLFSDFDQNPYYMFISPWRKYKRNKQLNDKKHWFRQNSLYYTNDTDTLNKEYFLYRINILGALCTQYSKQHVTRPAYLKIYKIIVYSLMKHLKYIQETLYLAASEVKELKQIEKQVQISLKQQKDGVYLQEKCPVRNIPFTNVQMTYLNEKGILEDLKPQEKENEYQNQRQKLNQSIFKPIFSTLLFALTMWAFK